MANDINLDIVENTPINIEINSGAIPQSFLGLSDTPTSYSGKSGKAVVVNSLEDGLDFTSIAGSSAVWGNITGTLSNQTDLLSSLTSKVTANVTITGATKPKITYDSKGLVTNGTTLALTDVPITSASKNYALLYNGTQAVWAAQGTSFTFSISSFTSNQGSDGTVFEMGTANTQWIMGTQIDFSATYANGPATNGYVSHTGWTNLTMTGTGFVGPTTTTQAVNYPSAVAGTNAFTLNATDGTDSPTSTITYYFYTKRFWGVSTVASGYTESNVEGLAGSELSNSRSKSFSVTPTTGQYIIYSYPTRLGTATFTVGGFEGGFESPETVSITNSSGYTENYYVYRSTNSGLGSTTVVVT